MLWEPNRWTDILIGYGISLAWWTGLLVVCRRYLDVAFMVEQPDPDPANWVLGWVLVAGPASILIWATILWRRGWDGFWSFLTPVGVTIGTAGLTAILPDPIGWGLPYPLGLGAFVVTASCVHVAVAVAWSRIASG